MAFRGAAGARVCRLEGCEQRVEAGLAYCRGHADDPEAVAFRRELASATSYFELAVEALDPDQVERAEAFQRFRARAKRGEFDRLLEAPTRRVLEQAAAVEGFALEVGALRYGLMRVLAEETDPSRMALALARLSNAVVRASAPRGGGREEGGRTDDQGDVADRLAAAMMGYDLEGREFTTTRDGIRAFAAMRRREPEWQGAWERRAEADERWAGALAAVGVMEVERREEREARRREERKDGPT